MIFLFFRMDVEAAEELYRSYGGSTPTSKVCIIKCHL